MPRNAHWDSSNQLQYARENGGRISCLTVTELICGISLTSVGLGLLDVCKNVAGCNSSGETACGEYYFGGWVKSGINIWGGVLITILGGYGCLRRKSLETHKMVRRLYITSVCGVLLSFMLSILEGAASITILVCESENSQGLSTLFWLSTTTYIVLFFIFKKVTKYTAISRRSRTIRNGTEEVNIPPPRQNDRAAREAGSTQDSPPSVRPPSYSHHFYRLQSLPGYTYDPPPEYDTVFPSSSTSASDEVQECSL